MARPKPAPVDPARLPELAMATMESAKFPMLATDDAGQPRLRPVSPVRTEGFTVWVANLRAYHKTGEIAARRRSKKFIFLAAWAVPPGRKAHAISGVGHSHAELC